MPINENTFLSSITRKLSQEQSQSLCTDTQILPLQSPSEGAKWSFLLKQWSRTLSSWVYTVLWNRHSGLPCNAQTYRCPCVKKLMSNRNWALYLCLAAEIPYFKGSCTRQLWFFIPSPTNNSVRRGENCLLLCGISLLRDPRFVGNTKSLYSNTSQQFIPL